MFSSKSFIVSGLTFRSLNLFLNDLSGQRMSHGGQTWKQEAQGGGIVIFQTRAVPCGGELRNWAGHACILELGLTAPSDEMDGGVRKGRPLLWGPAVVIASGLSRWQCP